MKVKIIGSGCMISNDNPACYLIDNHILIDCPNGISKILRRKKLQLGIDSVVVTHTHADHIFDLPFVIYGKYVLNQNLYIYANKKNIKVIKKLLKLGFPHAYKDINKSKLIKYISLKEFKIDDINFVSYKVNHGKMKNCNGYTLYQNGKTITFTGDATYSEEIFNQCRKSDYAFLHVTSVITNAKHIGVNDVRYLLNQNNKLKIIASHLSPSSRKELGKVRSFHLIIARDFKDIRI